MKINDSRHKTLDEYSIKDVQVKYEKYQTGTDTYGVHTYLSVSLKPREYSRNRFQGASSEAKKEGARELKIELDELQKMTETLREQLDLCYRVLNEHELLDELAETKQTQQKVG